MAMAEEEVEVEETTTMATTAVGVGTRRAVAHLGLIPTTAISSFSPSSSARRRVRSATFGWLRRWQEPPHVIPGPSPNLGQSGK